MRPLVGSIPERLASLRLSRGGCPPESSRSDQTLQDLRRRMPAVGVVRQPNAQRTEPCSFASFPDLKRSHV